MPRSLIGTPRIGLPRRGKPLIGSPALVSAFKRPVSAPAGDGFPVLAALNTASKVVCAWILPNDDPDRDLTLNGAAAEGWTAAYGTQKVNLAFETAAPQWDATLFSNKGGMTFNGTTQRLLGTGNVANWPAGTEDLYMISAGRQDGTGFRHALAYGAAGTTTRAIRNSGTAPVIANVALGSSVVTGVTNAAGAHTVAALFDIGGTSKVYLDGVEDGSASTASAALTLTRVRIGASAAASATQFWSGAIVAAAILNSTATLQNFLDLEAEFRGRLV